MKRVFKGIGIGVGIGIAVYASGLIKDYRERAELERERENFGTGK
ncbi:hypothetical protein [Bacillus shivajii]|nr:hypothetical protein [Bacillus shivajii]